MALCPPLSMPTGVKLDPGCGEAAAGANANASGASSSSPDPTLTPEAAAAGLLSAAAAGDVPAVLRCLAAGAAPGTPDPATGDTPLHRAAHRGQLGALEVLLAAGADPNARDRDRRTPLFAAGGGGHVHAVAALLAGGALLFPPEAPHEQQRQRQQQQHSAAAAACPCGQQHAAQRPPAPAPPPPGAPAAAAAEEDEDAAFLALRATCPLAAAAAAARWGVVAALLGGLPPAFRADAAALRSLRFLIWALASHKAFPRDVMARLPPRLPPCVLDTARPAHLASTALVLAAGNDQQLLMQWLLAQGADPEAGAPLLLCAGRFCRGSRSCCVSTLLRRGARPHVAWADTPADSPLRLAARGDCFSHVHALVAHGADVHGEAAAVRQELYEEPAWERTLEALLPRHAGRMRAPACDLLCPCGQTHGAWAGLWPMDEPGPGGGGGGGGGGAAAAGPGAAGWGLAAGESGSSCHHPLPADDAWYRRHRRDMEHLQDGNELGECRTAVEELWRFACGAVEAQLRAVHGVQQHQPGGDGGGASPYSLWPEAVLAAMQDVGGGWLAAASRCRQQRLLRAALNDKAVAAGRELLRRRRVAALAALSGAGLAATASAAPPPPACAAGGAAAAAAAAGGGLPPELRAEVLALAGLAPPDVEARMQATRPGRRVCGCEGCPRR